tara:strand:- start:8633 stop:9133 length:501 start_codon:yes stop_codon:yes gene_type:complete
MKGFDMPSFDIVSKVDMAEVDNAINNVVREVRQRYDFKDSGTSLDRSDSIITLITEDDLKLSSLQDLLKQQMSKRGVALKSLSFEPPVKAGGDTLRQTVNVKQGVDATLSKDIIKKVKAKKLKVQMSIKGDEIRVTGKKRDDLQETISVIKAIELPIPLQYVNFRD